MFSYTDYLTSAPVSSQGAAAVGSLVVRGAAGSGSKRDAEPSAINCISFITNFDLTECFILIHIASSSRCCTFGLAGAPWRRARRALSAADALDPICGSELQLIAICCILYSVFFLSVRPRRFSTVPGVGRGTVLLLLLDTFSVFLVGRSSRRNGCFRACVAVGLHQTHIDQQLHSIANGAVHQPVVGVVCKQLLNEINAFLRCVWDQT